ncbi:MAG: chromate transporter [Clostridia bacterium]|nr:chromate transporter [Clostridia bacterium]
MILLELLAGFLEIGLFSFGGAYGAIPLIREVVLSYGWIGEEELSYMIAVSESTPGPIMINMATYIGSVKAGVPGALIATAAVALPAFVIVIILTAVFKKLTENGAFKSILGSLKNCVAGVILATGVYMMFNVCTGGVGIMSVDLPAIILAAVLGTLYFGAKKVIGKGVSPIILICVAGAAGVMIYGF